MSIKELLEEAQRAGLDRLALTDINTTSACLDFIRLASKYNINPVVGIDFRNGAEQKFIGLAQNNDGFEEINRYLSIHLEKEEDFPQRPPSFNNVYIIYPLEQYTGFPLKPWEFVGVKPQQLLHKYIRNKNIPTHRLVLLHSVSFQNKAGFNAHRLLRAIDNNTLLSKLPTNEQGVETDRFFAPDAFRKRMELHPYLIENAEKVINGCEISFCFNSPKNKAVYGASEYDDYIQIQALAYKGMAERYNKPTLEIKTRLEKELDIIHKMGFVAYFLINWDIVNYAQSKGYYYVGRGSGANSMVAYCLYITNVDPIDLDLYFERFISTARKTPPDFDMDFSWADRDDIINYLFTRHQKAHTAMLATYNTFKDKSATREIGKVFGLPKHEIDALTRMHHPNQAPNQLSKLVLQYGSKIQNFPNHLGIHAGGIIISNLPMYRYTAQNFPPKGFPTTQFSMQEAEDIGLNKFDILSQRGLGKIKDALEIIKLNHKKDLKPEIDNMELLKKDPRIKAQLKIGSTIGCFYVESPAMRMLLAKLKATTYRGLVAASSIIRPGVAKSGMMREYILRFRRPEKRHYVHPKLKELMAETFGVMVYQEDVLKVAHYFAGLTLDEADILRRGMSWKFRERNEFHKVQGKFFENCKRYGYSAELTKDVWTQIESFANYAFSKGHSASYAVESYQSLYIKAYYPLEYMVATINNGGGFYRRESYIHEARQHGGIIHAPCINKSQPLTTLYNKDIYLGFLLINEIEHKVALSIYQERVTKGRFTSLHNFLMRVSIGKEQLILLIRMGAFRFTNKTKKELLWDACMLTGETPKKHSGKLFNVVPPTVKIPQLHYHDHEDALDEIELLGFPLSSPFLLTKKVIPQHVPVQFMKDHIEQRITMVGYLVHRKTTKTSSGKTMHFGTFTDREGLFIDTVHFPPSLAHSPFQGRGIYVLIGTVKEEFDFYSLEVEKMERLEYIPDPRYD